jgi:hypothetical protein
MTLTPCDTPGGEATPLLDLEKCVPEEQGAPPPPDDRAATMCGQWFLRVRTYDAAYIDYFRSIDRSQPQKAKNPNAIGNANWNFACLICRWYWAPCGCSS